MDLPTALVVVALVILGGVATVVHALSPARRAAAFEPLRSPRPPPRTTPADPAERRERPEPGTGQEGRGAVLEVDLRGSHQAPHLDGEGDQRRDG